MCNNKYTRARVNSTEFENRVLKDNKYCNISIEPKYGSSYKYLSVILLDSILIYSDSYCSDIYYLQVFLKKYIYVRDKKAALLGKHIY